MKIKAVGAVRQLHTAGFSKTLGRLFLYVLQYFLFALDPALGIFLSVSFRTPHPPP